jgi:DNA segregation ATPase FtsK/SpoIIIE, S-DNA-T family
MAKKKKQGSKRKLSFLKVPSVEIPESAKRLTWAVSFFAAALIFTFSFFEQAGAVGTFLFSGAQFLLGTVAFLIPLFFVVAGLVFWGMRTYRIAPVVFALVLLVGAAAGLAGQQGGWVGFIISWPLLLAFEFWVTEIILGAVAFVAAIIFWQLLPHEPPQERVSLTQGATEKFKSIFEPKIHVDEVESEPTESVPQKISDTKIPFLKKKPVREPSVAQSPELGDYNVPPIDLLEAEKGAPNAGDIKNYSAIIKKTLQNFDIPVEISEVNIGPTVTQYSFKPAEGIKLSRIVALQNDLSLALAAHPLRIEAPIPGRALVGIEIPNKTRATVRLRSLIENEQFKNFPSSLALALGRDVSGAPVIADLAKMPHMLVAGATGAGKTIGLSNIVLSLAFRNSPRTVRLILVDPKRVEFPVYGDLPHLLTPVIVDTQRAVNALKWLIKEMERRFQVLSAARARDIGSYHALPASNSAATEELPYIVVIIDELADLMAARGKEMEAMIVRLAQMARAVGIHLVLATQRPSVEVLTGLIKANITSRMAFQVASQIDSRTILDSSGAEKLLGQGDMLFISSDFSKPKRIQGAFVSDKDVKKVVGWIANETQSVSQENMDGDDELSHSALEGLESGSYEDEDDDPLYEEAKRVIIESKRASASLLQRRLKLGYARAARLIDILEERGVVGPAEGSRPRQVYGVSSSSEDANWAQP